MDVVILSRGKTQVAFQRQADGKRFSCGIRDLSLMSKCKIYWYFRESGGSASAQSAGVLGDLHLRGIREEMEEVAEDLSLAEYRFNAAETSTQERAIKNEIATLELKMEKLKYKQANYLSHRQ